MIKEKPLTAKAYDYVYDSIISGKYTSNDILTESQLISELQISKSPVREALIMLCEESVLQAIPRVGYKVVQIMPFQVSKLIEARLLLEPYLLQKGWNAISDLQIQQILNFEKRKTESSIKSIGSEWNGNVEFHMLIASFADNEYLLSALHKVLKTCSRVASQYYLDNRGERKQNRNYHPMIIEGLQQHDYEKTLNALQMDIREII